MKKLTVYCGCVALLGALYTARAAYADEEQAEVQPSPYTAGSKLKARFAPYVNDQRRRRRSKSFATTPAPDGKTFSRSGELIFREDGVYQLLAPCSDEMKSRIGSHPRAESRIPPAYATDKGCVFTYRAAPWASAEDIDSSLKMRLNTHVVLKLQRNKSGRMFITDVR